jgi:hypothetical protein
MVVSKEPGYIGIWQLAENTQKKGEKKEPRENIQNTKRKIREKKVH